MEEETLAIPAEETPTKVMLPLDAPRQISLKTKQRSYLFKTRRVTGDDWRQYFGAIVRQVVHTEGGSEEIFESESALVELVDRVLLSLEGFDRGGKDWMAAIPFKHRLAIGIVLRNVGTGASALAPEPCDLSEVTLDATWPTEGKSVMYAGLIHRFRHPSIEQLKRFNYESSRVRVRGNAQDGVSVYPSRQAIAMKMYDELIECVDGYSVNGKPLEGAEQIRKEMDGAHKAAAALHLFLGSDEIEIE